MGPDAPSHFTQKDDPILMRGLLPSIPLDAEEDVIRKEISNIICSCTDHDLSCCQPSDFEFIDMNGKHASLPVCKPGFVFNGKSIKQLAGGGCVYVRMTRDVSDSDIDDSIQSSLEEDTDREVTVVKVEHAPAVPPVGSRGIPSQTTADL